MRRALLTGMLCLLAAAGALAEDGYEVIEDTDGLRVERRSGRLSPVDAVRISVRVAAPAADLAEQVWSGEDERALVPHLVESRILASEGDTLFRLGRLDLPLASDRLYVVRVQRKSDPLSGTIELHFALARERIAALALRGTPFSALDGWWRFAPIEHGRATWLVYQSEVDPGGAVPAWLASRLQRDSAIALVRGTMARAEARAAERATAAGDGGGSSNARATADVITPAASR